MFASHLRFAEVGGVLIQLDIAQDRYRQLGGALAAAVMATRDREPTDTERALLGDAGLVAPAGQGLPFAPVNVPATSFEALQDMTPDHGASAGRAGLASLARLRLSLRIRGFASVLQAAERRSRRMTHTDDAQAARLARGFEKCRQWYPFERRCLPDGLALYRLLADAGVRATLVIGVRTTPFAAHCWVQAGPWLLTDTRDMVAELTPILAI